MSSARVLATVCASFLCIVPVAQAQAPAAAGKGAPPPAAAAPAAAPAPAPAAAPAAGPVAEVPATSPCQADVDAFCKSVTPGEGDVLRCLGDNADSLSNNCKKHLTQLKKDYLASAADCDADTQKFCGSVPHTGGRLAQCLLKHTKELSPSCSALKAKLLAPKAAAAPAGAAPTPPAAPAPGK